MNPITLSWETWRAVIAVLRAKPIPYDPMATLSLTDDVFLRSDNWARLRLGIPLPPV